MPNREDDLARDEKDAISAELLLKKLREGLEQQPSKNNEDNSCKTRTAQISEETIKLAQSEIIRGKPEEFGSDELDEVKLRELMNMPVTEKKSETLLTKEECMHAYDLGNFYRVPADNRDLNYEQYFEKGQVEKAKLTEFTSDNTTMLDVEQVKEKLLSLENISTVSPFIAL